MEKYKQESLNKPVTPHSMPTPSHRPAKRYRPENRAYTRSMPQTPPKNQCSKQKEMPTRDRWSCEAYDKFPLAMAYVPWQHFRKLYDCEYESLSKGTIFKELYLPYVGRSCK